MPINIVIADKRRLIRDVLKSRFDTDVEIKVIGDTDDGYECLSFANRLHPNIVLSDADLNSLSGLKVLEIMHKQSIRSKFILLSDSFEMGQFSRAMNSGCDGYITKNVDFLELKKAIYSIYNGSRYIQEEFKKYESSLIMPDSDPDKEAELTNRELEILKLIAMGENNKEIGDRCNISERTVKNHIFNIYKKLQVNDRTQAAVYAIRNNIVKL